MILTYHVKWIHKLFSFQIQAGLGSAPEKLKMKESGGAGFIFPLKASHKGQYGEGGRRKEYFFKKIMFDICKFMKVLH